MAYYLVTAKLKNELLDQLQVELEVGKYLSLKPFGEEIQKALTNARLIDECTAVWEEEDYCSPPLAQERAAVLDRYFENIQVQDKGRWNGWKEIQHLPYLFPEIQNRFKLEIPQ